MGCKYLTFVKYKGKNQFYNTNCSNAGIDAYKNTISYN